jgi:ribose 5-phosphate isomerase B
VKRFDIVTEADARVLEYGSSIVLAAGGHITPLALDTLRARRVTVVRDDGSTEGTGVVLPARIARVAVAGDHVSLALKAAVLQHLRARGLTAHDLGTHSNEPVDYPETAATAARAVSVGEADAGIVIDGSGIGSSIAANKIAGIRAAMCPTVTLARYAREHNGINVLGLGAATMSPDVALEVVNAFLDTSIREPRYIRRLGLIGRLERRGAT